MASSPAEEIILRTRGISMLFPGTVALDNVDYNVWRGKVNVIIGENGAGKSTLMKILAGVQQPSLGEMELNGNIVHFSSTREAAAHGIGMVHQELNLFENLSVAENIFLGRELQRGLTPINEAEQERQAAELLQRLDQPISPRELVGNLKVGQQQLVEIAKALAENADILILDEPTSALSKTEVDILFRVIRELTRQGVTIIYISHRLEELMAIGDVITILRDGKLVATRETKNTSIREIAELMVGRKGEAMVEAAPRPVPSEKVAMSIHDLHVDMPGEQVNSLSVDIYEGEIFGIGGLAGQGKLGIPNGIMGLYDAEGKVELFGQELNFKDTRSVLSAGVAMVSEDRKGVGLLLDRSIEDNIVFNAMQIKGEYLKKFGPFTQIDSKKIRETAEEYIKSLDIRCFGPTQHSGTLSGGNQQKVCIAKALCMSPKFLFVSEPTRGIDIGAKKLVLETLVRLNRELGMTVVIVSSELQELKSVSDRIAIVSEGKLVDILSPQAPDADYGLAMSGIKPSEHTEKGGTEE